MWFSRVFKFNLNYCEFTDPLLPSQAFFESGTELFKGLNQLNTKVNTRLQSVSVLKIYLTQQSGRKSWPLNWTSLCQFILILLVLKSGVQVYFWIYGFAIFCYFYIILICLKKSAVLENVKIRDQDLWPDCVWCWMCFMVPTLYLPNVQITIKWINMRNLSKMPYPRKLPSYI